MFKITAKEKEWILKRRVQAAGLGAWIKELRFFNKNDNLGLDAEDFKNIYSLLSIHGRQLKPLIKRGQLDAKTRP